MTESLDHTTANPPAPSSSAQPGDPLTHVGMVAVVGRTNAGKSTLVNRIVGEKISIVSPVVQTTRNVVRGVLTEGRGQLVLVDTPGLHKSRSTLCTMMNKHARAASEGVDLVLLVVDGSKAPLLEDEGWMQRLFASRVPRLIVLNKSDQGAKLDAYQARWQAIKEEKAVNDVVEPAWHVVSAQTGEGVEGLTAALFEALPSGPMLFEADMLSDYPKKLAVADIVREKFFLTLRDELPHSIGVKVESISPAETGGLVVQATIFVQKFNHKGIVIGPKGRGLRTVRRQAEADLTAYFEQPVTLDMWIKVEKNWDQNFFLLKQMGYI